MAGTDSTVLPSRVKDLTGQVFGRLAVVEYAGLGKRRQAFWLCRCKCGAIVTVVSGDLCRGQTRSCGCLKADLAHARRFKHGLSTTGTYNSWAAMIRRCFDATNDSYPRYGHTGITVCERWLSFEHFFADIGHRPSAAHSIERIDGNGNYEPGNCVWATASEQARNRRNNHVITFAGRTLCIAEWSNRTGIHASTLCKRLNDYGWSVERALTTPVHAKAPIRPG